jgi:hypothetical protein
MSSGDERSLYVTRFSEYIADRTKEAAAGGVVSSRDESLLYVTMLWK